MERDLGVTFSSSMKSSEQCKEACTRANRVLGMIKRTIVNKISSIMVQLYKSLVRPHLEYCSPVWSPQYNKDKQMLEKVQRRFTRMIPELKRVEYRSRLQRLGLGH